MSTKDLKVDTHPTKVLLVGHRTSTPLYKKMKTKQKTDKSSPEPWQTSQRNVMATVQLHRTSQL